MTRILHVSDLHGKTPWLKWLVDESAKYDLVCLTGDILNLGDVSCDPEREIAEAMPYLQTVDAPLALCSGNHDLHYLAGQDTAQWMKGLRRKNVWIDGDAFWFHDYRFRCIAWCDRVPRSSNDDFWLMHAPPFGAKTSTMTGGILYGDEELRDVCLLGQGPRFVLSGHVHQPLNFSSLLQDTISLNPGQGNHPQVPNHVVLDLAKHTVIHHAATLAGIETTPLIIKP